MSLHDVCEWIRDQVREQHESNGGEVSTKGIAHAATFLLADDEEAAESVFQKWALSQAQRAARDVRSGHSVRSFLVPNGAGTYTPASQMTLFSLGEFAAKQRATGRTIAKLASRVLEIVNAAIDAGADETQRPEEVLSPEEMEAVYSLTRQANAA